MLGFGCCAGKNGCDCHQAKKKVQFLITLAS
jgi:hypothetical protein